jgi:hypothetical protein
MRLMEKAINGEVKVLTTLEKDLIAEVISLREAYRIIKKSLDCQIFVANELREELINLSPRGFYYGKNGDLSANR